MYIDYEAALNPRPVFVYGSLLQGLHNHRIIANLAETTTPASVSGVRLYAHGNAFPYAVAQEGEITKGEVVTVSEENWILALVSLDRLEGYRGAEADNHYNRVLTDVTLHDGTVIEAWMYVAAPDVAAVVRQNLPIVPNGDWRRWKRHADYINATQERYETA